jgi:L-alanine-DL-glutamate epimerase-like enolase superfamily enzyme
MRLAKFSFRPLDVPLHEPFGIATGAQHLAQNVLVRLACSDGIVGLGEAAPVEHISGESQAAVLEALSQVEGLLSGRELTNYRPVCAALEEALRHVPSALSAVEAALFDALSRRANVSLCEYFGGAETHLNIDVTITTGTVEQATRSAKKYAALGFHCLKVKIGGTPLEEDARRLRAICQAAPHCELIVDGNTAFSPSEALSLLKEIGPARSQIILFEQPVPRDDFAGLREVEAKSGIAVAADESLRTRDDFKQILRTGGISCINLKTAKLGLLTAWDLLIAGRAAGLQIMMGGMVETEVSMTTSACLAAGVGGVRFVDLDTPIFLGKRPLSGLVEPWGPTLDLSPIRLGHGVTETG